MYLRTLLRSPLIHFFALGAAIFAAFSALDDRPAAPPPDAIVLTPGQAGRLADQFEATWRRRPTPQELDGLMQSWALEEAQVREALALGLDRDDAVIRRRLAQKMEFLAESSAASLAPDDATLEAHLTEHADRFLRPARMAFDQLLLPASDDDAAVAETRSALERGEDPAMLGRPTLLPPRIPMSPAPAIDRLFGEGFHAALADLPVGRWQGPVESGYGPHLVRVTERNDAALPPLAEIRERVESDWRAAQLQEMRERFGQALLDRHAVTLPNAAEVLER